jgi:hypothetical protein
VLSGWPREWPQLSSFSFIAAGDILRRVTQSALAPAFSHRG